MAYFCAMKRSKYTFFTSFGCCALLFAACSPTNTRTQEESDAAAQLTCARQLLADRNYSGARDSILALRRNHPTAIQARRAAILTLDSIELMDARDSVAVMEAELESARAEFERMLPRINGQTNNAYYVQQRHIMALEQRYDELCAKVKFFLRKIDIDTRENAE